MHPREDIGWGRGDKDSKKRETKDKQMPRCRGQKERREKGWRQKYGDRNNERYADFAFVCSLQQSGEFLTYYVNG